MRKGGSAVLSIAGFDPSGGAGVLADIKTFDNFGIQACGIASSLTYQNETSFRDVKWLGVEEIKKQFEPLAEQYIFDYVKIGLIQGLDELSQITALLKSHNPRVKITWDPILKATAGFQFHSGFDESKMRDCMRELFLMTPNREEAVSLIQKPEPEEAAKELSKFTHVLLKGGHARGAEVSDRLYKGGELAAEFTAERIEGSGRHGSGCVHSSALTAMLAMGHELNEACEAAARFTRTYLNRDIKENSLISEV